MGHDVLSDLLNWDAEAWNHWRRSNPRVLIDLHGANLHKADLSGRDLSGADLQGAVMSKARLLHTDFTGANLSRANASRAVARSANFTGARLVNADLSMADLRKALFDHAELNLADLRGAKLGRARFRGASLPRTNLLGCNLFEADLTDALMSETLFADTVLNGVEGLERCRHAGPSIIDYRTLQQSGELPVNFLRGCGLPNDLIESQPSLSERAERYHSCFISYSSEDQEFAEYLYSRLQEHDVRCWFAPEDLKIGDRILDSLDEAIRLRDKLLLILSQSSIESGWVEDEVTRAFAEERERNRSVVFPITIDHAVLDTDRAWAVKLRDSRNIGNFRGWRDPSALETGITRLLRDLRRD